jgi:hypothetical protein
MAKAFPAGMGFFAKDNREESVEASGTMLSEI